MFTYVEPDSLIYDGAGKTASVMVNRDVEVGEITVKYYDEDGILSTGKFNEIIDPKDAEYYKLDKTIKEVSDILKPHLGEFVYEYFVYESLTEKKIYTFDQIPFTLEKIKGFVDIPELVKDTILENKVDKLEKSVKEVLQEWTSTISSV